MANLILIEVPGGNDFTVLEDAVRAGHDVTFCTSDLGHYRRQGPTTEAALALAREIIEVHPFDYAALETRLVQAHRIRPYDAIICLIDIRLVEASDLARRLGLRFLNPATARLSRDKVAVRQTLADRRVRQPRFALAETVDQLHAAAAKIGFPILIKPTDGYGSQNVSVILNAGDLHAYISSFPRADMPSTDYGLGVRANNRFSVEAYIRGNLIGCDIFSSAAGRILLGINDKLMFAPPSFAMRGSCFPSDRYDRSAIEEYAFQILDAIEYDFGAAHVEMIVADDGPYLVEVNARLVSAQIPYQMGYALERSIYVDLFNLHLGGAMTETTYRAAPWFSVIRWVTASRPGVLRGVHLPEGNHPHIRRVALFKEPGDAVRPPISNGDRIGYVIAVGKTQRDAEILADRYVQDTTVELN